MLAALALSVAAPVDDHLALHLEGKQKRGFKSKNTRNFAAIREGKSAGGAEDDPMGQRTLMVKRCVEGGEAGG